MKLCDDTRAQLTVYLKLQFLHSLSAESTFNCSCTLSPCIMHAQCF